MTPPSHTEALEIARFICNREADIPIIAALAANPTRRPSYDRTPYHHPSIRLCNVGA